MSRIVNDKKIFSLLEVTQSIQKTIAERYKSTFWVMAEMNKLNHYSHSGHCYPELLEKQGGKVVAQMRSNLWKADYIAINQKFINVLKEPLRDGIMILFCATVQADPVYGLNLRIIDIDPSFSLGELEKEKQKTIERLVEEKIFNNNKQLHMPLLPQRIAIISVETSKGYADFIKVIDENAWGYKFFYMLFPALLQGEKSIGAIMDQLNKIKKVRAHFDVVAIIRGGGGDVGLSSFNHYMLSREIALFPIPVITGIGHATNETVAEMVSHRNAITPTELADFLLQEFHNFSVPVQQAHEKTAKHGIQLLVHENTRLLNMSKYFRLASNSILNKKHELLKGTRQSIKLHTRYSINAQREALKHTGALLRRSGSSGIATQQANIVSLEKSVSMLNPSNVLKRGYSITLKNGKALFSSGQVAGGDVITTVLSDGEVTSNVVSVKLSE